MPLSQNVVFFPLDSNGVFFYCPSSLFAYFTVVTALDIPKPAKCCSVSQREFQSGETFFSVLSEERNVWRREDFAPDHWSEPETLPKHWVAWWKTAYPQTGEKKVQMAPNDVLLDMFDELTFQPEQSVLRYVLTLLLIRRRVFRYEKESADKFGQKVLVVFGIKNNVMYEVPVAMPDAEQLEEIQTRLSEILYS